MIPKRQQREFQVRPDRLKPNVAIIHWPCQQLVASDQDFSLERITELCEEHLDECPSRRAD